MAFRRNAKRATRDDWYCSKRVEDDEYVGKVLDIELVSLPSLSSSRRIQLDPAFPVYGTAPSDSPVRHPYAVRLFLPPTGLFKPRVDGHVEGVEGKWTGEVYRGDRAGPCEAFLSAFRGCSRGRVGGHAWWNGRRRDGGWYGRDDSSCGGRDGDEKKWGGQGLATRLDGEEGESSISTPLTRPNCELTESATWRFQKGPAIPSIMAVLGKEECVERLKDVEQWLQGGKM